MNINAHEIIKTKLACKRTYYAALRTGFAIVLIGFQLNQKWVLGVGVILLLINLLKSRKLNKQLKSNLLVSDDDEWYDYSDVLLFGASILIVVKANNKSLISID